MLHFHGMHCHHACIADPLRNGWADQDTCLCLQMMQPALGPTTFKVLTSLLRTINNIAGGISFVLLAKMAGVQATATQDA